MRDSDVPCEYCEAASGAPCKTKSGRRRSRSHLDRRCAFSVDRRTVREALLKGHCEHCDGTRSAHLILAADVARLHCDRCHSVIQAMEKPEGLKLASEAGVKLYGRVKRC